MKQTDRFATELRKELSKMQRQREKLRDWLAYCRPEHHARLDAAKVVVETDMYRYRTFEKSWKYRKGVFAIGHVRPHPVHHITQTISHMRVRQSVAPWRD